MKDIVRWNLKAAILRKGVTQVRVAYEIARNDVWFSNMIRGYVEPSPEEKQRIAEILDVEEEGLFVRGRDGSESEPNSSGNSH